MVSYCRFAKIPSSAISSSAEYLVARRSGSQQVPLSSSGHAPVLNHSWHLGVVKCPQNARNAQLLAMAGEILVGPKKVIFADEISTGLDSSTTYQIVRCVRNIVKLRRATVLMSLLQPAPETFELFDDVMLLSEGGPSLPRCFASQNK